MMMVKKLGCTTENYISPISIKISTFGNLCPLWNAVARVSYKADKGKNMLHFCLIQTGIPLHFKELLSRWQCRCLHLMVVVYLDFLGFFMWMVHFRIMLLDHSHYHSHFSGTSHNCLWVGEVWFFPLNHSILTALLFLVYKLQTHLMFTNIYFWC